MCGACLDPPLRGGDDISVSQELNTLSGFMVTMLFLLLLLITPMQEESRLDPERKVNCYRGLLCVKAEEVTLALLDSPAKRLPPTGFDPGNFLGPPNFGDKGC